MTVDSPVDIGKHPAYVWVMLICCVIAVVLNILVIFAVVKFGRYRSTIDIFLTNLAASDIIHAGIVTPMHFKNVEAYNKDFYGGNFVCKLIMFMPLLSVMGAIFTIVAMAIDRYRVVVANKQTYRRGAIMAIFVIWIAAFLVSAPQLYEYNVYLDVEEYNPNTTYQSCGSEGIVKNFETIYATLVFIFAFLAPLIILIACYTKIVVHVWKHGKRFRSTQMSSGESSSTQNTQFNRTDKMLTARMVKMLKMLISITVTFVLFWTPYFIIFGITEIMGIDDTSNFAEWPHVVCRAMTVLSTISNPVIYLAFSETFRRELCGVLTCNSFLDSSSGCQCCIRSNRVYPSSSVDREKNERSVNVDINSVPLQLETFKTDTTASRIHHCSYAC